MKTTTVKSLLKLYLTMVYYAYLSYHNCSLNSLWRILMKRYFIFSMVFLSFKTFAFCFENAGGYYGVNPHLLKAIATVESSLNPSAINKNENSLGLMQIHPQWFSRLSEFDITPDLLLSDPCVNVNAGAWILAWNFKTHGKNWNSVGAYNAGFSKKRHVQKNRDIYISKVKKALQAIKNKSKLY